MVRDCASPSRIDTDRGSWVELMRRRGPLRLGEMHDVNSRGTVRRTCAESCLADPRVRRQSQPSQLARADDEGRTLLDDRHSRQVADNDLEGVCSGHPCELPVSLSARSRVKREPVPAEYIRVLTDCRVPDVPVPRRSIPAADVGSAMQQGRVLAVLPLDAIPGTLGRLQHGEHPGRMETRLLHWWSSVFNGAHPRPDLGCDQSEESIVASLLAESQRDWQTKSGRTARVQSQSPDVGPSWSLVRPTFDS